MPEKTEARRTPTLDGIALQESDRSREPTEAPALEVKKYRYWSVFTLVVGLVAPVALIAGLVTWFRIAGEAGSPQPENWSQMLQVMRSIERSLLPLLAISIVAPFAWRASTQGRTWGIYPVPILLVMTLALLFLF